MFTLHWYKASKTRVVLHISWMLCSGSSCLGCSSCGWMIHLKCYIVLIWHIPYNFKVQNVCFFNSRYLYSTSILLNSNFSVVNKHYSNGCTLWAISHHVISLPEQKLGVLVLVKHVYSCTSSLVIRVYSEFVFVLHYLLRCYT